MRFTDLQVLKKLAEASVYYSVILLFASEQQRN